MKKILYFGCIREAGHYLFESNNSKVYRTEGIAKELKANPHVLKYIDGLYPPHIEVEGKYLESNVPPFKIISWWDRSQDKRPGSNSTLLAVGYESADEILDAAEKLYPSVFTRQARPQPFKII